MDEIEQHHPDRTYVHLGTGPEVTLLDVGPDFWERIDERTDLGRMITSLLMTDDWPSWEMHPTGDEVILVTEGEVRFHLDDGKSVVHDTVTAPRYIVVPSGVWHTADALGPARLVVVTWGEGTEHRPRRPAPPLP